LFNLFNLEDTSDFEFLLSQIGQDIIKNGTETIKAIITNTKIEQNYDDRKISSLSPLNRGDLIEWDGKRWMIISETVSKRYNKYKGIIRLLPHRIIINSSCRFLTVDCFITTSNLGISSDRILSLPDGQIQVYFSRNYLEFDLKNDDRFMVGGQAFKLVGMDLFSQPGIVILTCEKDQINESIDDLVNEIAGGLACTVEITNTEPIEVYQGETLQLTWNSNNAPVTFTSSDENIATVDASGLVTGVSIGQVTITIKNATNGLISDSVTVNVIEEPASYSIVITSASSPPNEIKKNLSKTYNAEVYNGSTLITDGSQPVSWQLFADDKVSGTTLATITSQNGTSCTVKNNNANSGYVQLRAMLQSDNTVVAWYRIQMAPLY